MICLLKMSMDKATRQRSELLDHSSYVCVCRGEGVQNFCVFLLSHHISQRVEGGLYQFLNGAPSAH